MSTKDLPEADVVTREDTRATTDAVNAVLSISPLAVVALTGGASLSVDVRAALRRAGVRTIETRTYWIAGRPGLY